MRDIQMLGCGESWPSLPVALIVGHVGGASRGKLSAPASAPRGGDAHPLGRAGHPVVDEGVADAVRVARHEVGGVAPEGDEATVGRKGGTEVLDVDYVRQG